MGCAVSKNGLQGDASVWQRSVEESGPVGGGGGGHHSSPPTTPNKEDHEKDVSLDHDQGDEDQGDNGHGDEDQEDDLDLDERRISNFDASNLVGSPSFREYCQPIESNFDEEDEDDDNVKDNQTEKEEKPTNEITPQEEVSEHRTRISSGIRRLRRATTAIATISNVRNIFNLSRLNIPRPLSSSSSLPTSGNHEANGREIAQMN